VDIQIYLRPVSLVVAASLALVATDVPTKTPATPKVECHLDVAEKSGPASSWMTGEFMLKNTSAEPLKIEYYIDPKMNLDLDVKDEKGKVLPKCIKAYGMIYSDVILRGQPPYVLTIKPGETYSAHVVLLVQVDREKHPITPGKYTVEAVYKWKTPVGTAGSVKSEKVTIEVTAE
jgi:hypothetical protein